jgi:hypothetical protein
VYRLANSKRDLFGEASKQAKAKAHAKGVARAKRVLGPSTKR